MNALRWLAAGVTINLALYAVAVSTGLLGPTVTAEATGAPLTWVPVAAATLAGAIGALALRMAFSRIFGTRTKARWSFVVLAVLALLVSFASPVFGLRGASVGDIVVLDAMHVVATVTAIFVAEWIARPAWRFGEEPYAERTLTPRTAVVTGATSGIGAEVALELARRGFQVIGIGRNATSAAALEARDPNLRVLLGDLSSMRDAARLAEAVRERLGGGVGVLVHCVGTLKPHSSTTVEGIDANFASSFLGRVALSAGLELGRARVVNVAAGERGGLPSFLRRELGSASDVGDGMRSHGQAQLANDLWVASLARAGNAVFGYGPGAVDTGIRRELPRLIVALMAPIFALDTRRPQEAARDVVRLLLDASLPSSGFADREGLFDPDPFLLDPVRQDASSRLANQLIALARDPTSPPRTP